MKNVLIIGSPRAGKTTLSRLINQKLKYSIINLDDIVSAFQVAHPQLGIRHDEDDNKVAANFAPFLLAYLKALSDGPNFYGDCKFVVEGTHIDFEKVISSIDKKKYLVLGLTYNETSSEEIYNNLKKHDTEDDWTYWSTEDQLKEDVKYFIKRNSWFNKKFKEYDIKTFDTSKNREGILDNTIKYIEDNINELTPTV